MPTAASTIAVIVLLNGVPVDFGQVPPRLKPFLKDGVVMVPVRPVLESLDARVHFIEVPDYQRAPCKHFLHTYVTYEGKEVDLEREYDKTVQEVEQLTAPITWPTQPKMPRARLTATTYSEYVPGGPEKTYRRIMPLGFLSKTFGFSLQWDGTKKVVRITTRTEPKAPVTQ